MAGEALEERPSLVRTVGAGFLGLSELMGGFAVLFVRLIGRLPPLGRGTSRLDGRNLVRNLHDMGWESLPIVSVTGLFTGIIMVIQAAPLIEKYQAFGLLGWGAGFGTLREIGPLLTALMISGRVGANNTAELGTMVVTEQIDAMRTMAIDPLGFLVAPRFFAIVVTLFCATLFADCLALIGAAFGSEPLLGVSARLFYNGLTNGQLGFRDVEHGLVKSIFFGIIIGLSSCYYGINVKGGAPGVGRAVNSTVVMSAASIFVIDYFVSFLAGG